ncbi:AAA family ATPase [Marinovum sp. 2_MG-2023]|uniref:AAA family ATPase n=2 Tax=unclassified Marinovum TaxID=2647166 RepID=UPI0026E12A03|nr:MULTISPECIES: AAA family ATPase [unclassified Marinovum]MDO6731676.1 AAA family ATPase [Marinovum sp. 2_MG-2023]MDO6780928.1 AAA family ATPase [Marinovum sp. 1_MG-2023]
MTDETAFEMGILPIVACTISRNVQEFELLIEDMETALGEQWGDLGFEEAIPFFAQEDAESLEFIAIAMDAEDEADLPLLSDVIGAARDRDIRVILITENMSPAALHRLMRKGADEFVPYPLPEGALQEVIDRVRSPEPKTAMSNRTQPDGPHDPAGDDMDDIDWLNDEVPEAPKARAPKAEIEPQVAEEPAQDTGPATADLSVDDRLEDGTDDNLPVADAPEAAEPPAPEAAVADADPSEPVPDEATTPEPPQQEPAAEAPVSEAPETEEPAIEKKVKLRKGATRDGVLIAVQGLAGGVGATTFATNLAWELAIIDKANPPKVCLLDLDLQFGSVATYLDLPRREAVFELLSDIESMDEDSFGQALMEYEEKMQVLTAPADVLPLDFLQPQDIEKLFETAAAHFDYVIIDMPATLVQWSETILNMAHVYFAMLEIDMRSAQNALRLKRALQSEDLPFEKLRFLLNRAPKFTDLTGKSRVKRMAESLGIAMDVQFPDGGKPVVQACDHGLPLAAAAGKNPLRREIAKLAKSLHEIGKDDAEAA